MHLPVQNKRKMPKLSNAGIRFAIFWKLFDVDSCGPSWSAGVMTYPKGFSGRSLHGRCSNLVSSCSVTSHVAIITKSSEILQGRPLLQWHGGKIHIFKLKTSPVKNPWAVWNSQFHLQKMITVTRGTVRHPRVPRNSLVFATRSFWHGETRDLKQFLKGLKPVNTQANFRFGPFCKMQEGIFGYFKFVGVFWVNVCHFWSRALHRMFKCGLCSSDGYGKQPAQLGGNAPPPIRPSLRFLGVEMVATHM